MTTKEQLVEHLQKTGAIKTQKVLNAFLNIDRANFVPEDKQVFAYVDSPLEIGYGQTISQPTVVAFMLELLDAKEGDKVLDVGSGSGWVLSLLANIVGEGGFVHGVEKVPELVDFANENKDKYNIKNAEVKEAYVDKLGLPEFSPFDKIHAAAAANEIEQKLLEQLKSPGKMVLPVRNSIFLIDKDNSGGITKEEHKGFVFVPLL